MRTERAVFFGTHFLRTGMGTFSTHMAFGKFLCYP